MQFLAGTFLGAAIIALASLGRRAPERLNDLAIAVLFAASPIIFAFMAVVTAAFRPQPIDVALYRADLAIGLDPFFLMHLVRSSWTVLIALFVGYAALPTIVGLAWAIERSKVMLISAALAPLVAFFFYILFPGVGPARAFAGPSHEAVPWQHLGGLPRDCFPSMHLGWAFLVAVNARGRIWRAVTWVFVVFTIFATVGLGEHYFIDLIAAVPFCLGIQYVVAAKLLPASRKATPHDSAIQAPAFSLQEMD